jgi:hypothetical protein
VVADPERLSSILDHVGDVTVVFWLMGNALGEPSLMDAIHGPRLERFLEKLVDSPVRGFVYEGSGEVGPRYRERGAALARAAGERWHIPVQVVTAEPQDPTAWSRAMLEAAARLTG